MCQHDLIIVGRMKRKDGRECLSLACGKCNRTFEAVETTSD